MNTIIYVAHKVGEKPSGWFKTKEEAVKNAGVGKIEIKEYLYPALILVDYQVVKV